MKKLGKKESWWKGFLNSSLKLNQFLDVFIFLFKCLGVLDFNTIVQHNDHWLYTLSWWMMNLLNWLRPHVTNLTNNSYPLNFHELENLPCTIVHLIVQLPKTILESSKWQVPIKHPIEFSTRFWVWYPWYPRQGKWLIGFPISSNLFPFLIFPFSFG